MSGFIGSLGQGNAGSPLGELGLTTAIPGSGGLFSQNGIQLYHTAPYVNNKAALFELRIVMPNIKVVTGSTTGTAYTPQQLAALFPLNGPSPFSQRFTNGLLKTQQTHTPVTQKKTVLLNRYIFPISPVGLRKSYVNVNTPYKVAGSPYNLNNPGVERLMDMFGQEPPSWVIEGTTGWQYHSNDGMQTTGIESFHNLQTILSQYNYYVQNQIATQSKIQYELELYDYFNQEYWVVVPAGPYVFEMNASRPLIGNYRIDLLGIRPVKQPPKPLLLKSDLTQRLTSTVANAASSVLGLANSVSSAAGELF